MTENTENVGGQLVSRWRIAAWTGAALILLLPLLAMQFTDEVNWDVADFVIFGALLLGFGFTFELAARKTGSPSYNTAYRAGFGIALLGAFLIVWVNGAVGIIGNESNDANLMYFGVLAIGIVGAFIARFEATGMARVMIATTSAQVLAFVVALAAGWGFTWLVTVIFSALWLGSALMFRRAAAEALPPVGVAES